MCSSRPAGSDALRHNGDRLVLSRVVGVVQAANANQVVDHEGRLRVRPGQGGVTLGVGPGDPADVWASDHLEPGASVGHPDRAANHALQLLSCVGNPAVVVDGPAAGARGVVVGKHGAILVAFAPDALARLAPGETVVVDARGVGLAIEGETEIALHSCSPELLNRLVAGRDEAGRLRVAVAAVLPAEAAAAGIGMDVARFNVDLQIDQPPIDERAAGLRFGDLVAVLDHDHRFGRQYRSGWVAVGVVAHGHSVGGGHGLGMVTLLTGPRDSLALEVTTEACLSNLVRFPWMA